ncbi:hypothetical protein IRJ41_008880 [Triplophysa rosa]|uniref:Uncharacterized protein n=1 Tax=Triplophysa rosa TaxID=992332 RepID=A0A9W7WMA0_TRIRA|nr:hypothetical protein IRJ41_008880 [Triplophysa rosa]
MRSRRQTLSDGEREGRRKAQRRSERQDIVAPRQQNTRNQGKRARAAQSTRKNQPPRITLPVLSQPPRLIQRVHESNSSPRTPDILDTLKRLSSNDRLKPERTSAFLTKRLTGHGRQSDLYPPRSPRHWDASWSV